jgi:hypothetical protein
MWFAASSNCQEYLPVKKQALDGEHFGLQTKAFVKSTPSFAIRSKLGVFIYLEPYTPILFLEISSPIITRIFGRLFWATPPTEWKKLNVNKKEDANK